jgi:hypothetical protein
MRLSFIAASSSLSLSLFSLFSLFAVGVCVAFKSENHKAMLPFYKEINGQDFPIIFYLRLR